MAKEKKTKEKPKVNPYALTCKCGAPCSVGYHYDSKSKKLLEITVSSCCEKRVRRLKPEDCCGLRTK